MSNVETSRPYPGAPLTQLLPRLKWHVAAREYSDGSFGAKTYANRTQAHKAASYLNSGAPEGRGAWVVRQAPSSRVFYVCWCVEYSATPLPAGQPVEVRAIEPAETAFEVTERALAAEEACADWHEVL